MSRCHSDLIELRCPICGCSFFPLEGWVYRRGDKDLCSYHCTLAYDENKRRGELNALATYKRTLDAIAYSLTERTTTVKIVGMMRQKGIRVSNYKRLWQLYVAHYGGNLVKKDGYKIERKEI